MRGKPSPLKGLESPSCVAMSSRTMGVMLRLSRCTLKIVSLKKVGEKVWVQEATPLSFSPRSVAAFALPSRVVGPSAQRRRVPPIGRVVGVPEEELVAWGELVVDSRCDCGLIPVVEAQSKPVGRHQGIHIGMRGQRRDAVKMCRQRTAAVDRNLIVGKGLPPPVGIGGHGIVQGEWPSLGVNQAAEIALPHLGSRHADRSRGGLSSGESPRRQRKRKSCSCRCRAWEGRPALQARRRTRCAPGGEA